MPEEDIDKEINILEKFKGDLKKKVFTLMLFTEYPTLSR